MLTCKTDNCADKGTKHSAPEVGTLVCGLCGQEMSSDV
jgi:hypothetical protein